MSGRIPLLIDTDPGVDDALALLMAFADPRHDVVGLTIAAGNVGLDHTVHNALKLCEIAGRTDLAVHPGCPVPLVHAAEDARYVHGADGFGDTGYAPSTHAAAPEHAALAICRLAREHAGKLLLVSLGPLTNLALALRLDPELPTRVARLVVMGGAVNGRGNTTVSAEFNLGFDPEAAHVVFEAFALDLADWEATLAHGFAHAEFERWLQAGDARAHFYADISRRTRAWAQAQRGREHWHSADALAMAYALAPEAAIDTVERRVTMELDGALTRGATVVDWLQRGGRHANARILLRYDQARFECLVRAALGAA